MRAALIETGPYLVSAALFVILVLLNMKVNEAMTTVDDILAKVRAQKTQTDSVVALISSIKFKLADALSNTKLPPEVEAKLAAIMPELEANTKELTDAINANTDAAPTDPVPAVSDPSTPVSPAAIPNETGTQPSNS